MTSRQYVFSPVASKYLTFINWIGPENQKEKAIGQVSLFILESTQKNHLKGHELTYIVFIDWIGPKNQKEKAISQVSFKIFYIENNLSHFEQLHGIFVTMSSLMT